MNSLGVLNGHWLMYMGAAMLLVGIGIYCLLTQRNLIKLFIGVEIIGKAVTLALMATGFVRGNVMTGQSLAITVIVVEVSVVAVALALIINLYHHTQSLDVRKLTKLKG